MNAQDSVDKRPEHIQALLDEETGPRFMGLPERWIDHPTWRCANGHVSTWNVRRDCGDAVCPACMRPVWLTAPEDEEREV